MNATQSSGVGLPLRILTHEVYADHLEDVLEIPNTIRTVRGYSDDEIPVLLEQSDVFITTTFRSSWATDEVKVSLRLIHVPGAGTDGIEFSAVPSGCSVCNVYGHGHAIGEYVFMAMAALSRRLFALDAALREGDWGDRVYLPELRGRTLLILGLGHIGKELVRWGRFLGMRVTGITRSPSLERAQQLGLNALSGPADLLDYLSDADFVVVAVPQTAETTGMIGERELRQMKSSAFLVNVGRGPVVDEAALYNALREATIAGAAVDVWYQYPSGNERCLPSTYPFHELDNIIMTPHNAGSTNGTMRFRWDFIAQNLHRLQRGDLLENVVWRSSDA